MKSKVPIILSLALNVVLLALLFRPNPDHAPSPEPPPPDQVAANPAPATPREVQPQSTTTNIVFKQFNWESVESPDYRQYIANLRSIGCPEETIRDIIVADVNKLYEQKKKLARGKPRKFEFWKPAGNPMAGLMGDPETLKAMRALEEERQGVLRALGIEPDPMDAMMAMAGAGTMDAMFDFLPEEKRTLVTRTMTEFQTKMMESAQDNGGDPEAMMQSQLDMQKAIQAVLTPDEYLDYQLRYSSTAMMMRMQLDGFEPNEQEFLDVFKLRAAFDEEHNMLGMLNATEEELSQRNEAEDKLNEQIREVLGEDRYEDYQRSQDYQFQQLSRLVKNANLDATVANEVYDMKQIAEEQAAGIRADQSLSREQRDAALLAIRQETERSIRETMGDDGWEQYNRPNNIYWLRGISPTPNNTASESVPTEVQAQTYIVAP